MDRVKSIAEATNRIFEILASPDAEPDPDRRDWPKVKGLVDEAVGLAHNQVLADLDQACVDLEPKDQERFRNVCASAAGSVAALLAASGDRAGAADLLTKAQSAARQGAVRAELEACATAPDWHIRLARARWTQRRGDGDKAARMFERIAKNAPEPALREVAATLASAPRPIKSAPSLFTLNGFGVRLYGHRDARPDGTFVATTYVTALFVPVLPLSSYRVASQGRSWVFYGKVPLSPLQRLFRNGVLVAGLLAAVGGGVWSYLDSPDYRAGAAVRAAVAVEKSGRPEAAIAAYDAVLRDWGEQIDGSTLRPAAEGWVRLRSGAVHEPFTRTQVEEARRLVLRFEGIPAGARAGAPTEAMLAKLRAWQAQLGTDRWENIEAALALADLRDRVAPSADRSQLAREHADLHKTLAAALATDWPLDALHHDVQAGKDPEAIAAAAKILESLGDAHSLLFEAADDVRPWIALAKPDPNLASLAATVSDRLDRATKILTAQGRDEMLQWTDEKKLEAEHQQWPTDQGVPVAIAALQRTHGRVDAALATLNAIGPAGRLISEGQLLLAYCYRDVGKSDQAEPILRRYLARRLPKFQEAGRALAEAYDAAEKRFVNQAKAGNLPSDLSAKLEGAHDEGEKSRIFSQWLSDEAAKDGEVARRRQAYQAYQDVVGASLALGMTELQRANATPEPERQVLLSDAERTFLAIREEAEGSPLFHMGLGQVYYRLGRTEDGERELQGVLRSDDASLRIQVAYAYRSLGLVARSREILIPYVDAGKEPYADEAAGSLVAMADDYHEREKWLTRMKIDSPSKRASLAEIRGDLRMEEGKLAEADKELSQATSIWGSMAAHSQAAANNAALCWNKRYECTGDPGNLDKAVDLLDQARRFAPDEPTVVGNVASMTEERAHLAVLEAWLRTRVLKLRASEADSLVATLMHGPLREEAANRLRATPFYRRSVELSSQQALLAPRSLFPYERESRWLHWFLDRDGLDGLIDRVRRAGTIDTTYSDDARTKYENGSLDTELRQSSKSALAYLDTRLKDAERAGHAPTLAALHFLKAESLGAGSALDGNLGQMHASAEECRKAVTLWPELGADASLAHLLAQEGIYQAIRDDAAMAKAWKEDGRKVGLEVLACRTAMHSASTLEYLRKNPLIREGSELLRKRSPDPRIDLDDWIVGWMANDPALTSAAAAALKTGLARRSEDLLSLTTSPSPGKEARAEVLKVAMQ